MNKPALPSSAAVYAVNDKDRIFNPCNAVTSDHVFRLSQNRRSRGTRLIGHLAGNRPALIGMHRNGFAWQFGVECTQLLAISEFAVCIVWNGRVLKISKLCVSFQT